MSKPHEDGNYTIEEQFGGSTDPQAFEAALENESQRMRVRRSSNFAEGIIFGGKFARAWVLANDPVVRAMADAIREFDEACILAGERTTAWCERWENARSALTSALAAYREACGNRQSPPPADDSSATADHAGKGEA